MKKPVLMIHEVYEDIFSLPLEQYTLTFDDGLYSQFYFFDRFKNIPTEKIYFISSGIISDGIQSQSFPPCREAHSKAFEGNTEDYMTIAQIRQLMMDPWVSIGGHSHYHTDLNNLRMADQITHIKQDTETMVKWFEDFLGFKPTKFCYPYNNDLTGLYDVILDRYQITERYGRERIPVETLLHKQHQIATHGDVLNQ